MEIKEKRVSLIFLRHLKEYFKRQVKEDEWNPELSNNIDIVNALIETIKEQ